MDSYEACQQDTVNVSAPDDEEIQIDYTDAIEENHLLLVTCLQLDRYFLFSYLRTKGILDEEDVELVTNTGTTRQQRVSRFLDMIKRKGKVGMLHFVNALQYENPTLYEKLTGKKVDTPLLSFPAGNLNFTTGLPGKEIIDFDRNFLAKQFAQSTQEMQCLAQVHQKVLEEKYILEKKLMQANNDLQVKEEEIDFQKKMNDTISKMQPMEGNHDMMGTHYSKLLNQQGFQILQKDHLVAVLHGKLLELMEEMENTRKENLEIKTKNNAYSRENLELQFRYNSEKRQSVLLKERVQNQEYGMRYIDRFKTDMKHNITDTISLREENIALKKEVEEFRKYGEVLCTRFKLAVKEKSVVSEKQKEMSNFYLHAQRQVSELLNEITMLQLEKEHLQRTHERSIGDISISLELQNSLENEWKKVREERDKLYKALEEAKHEKDIAEKVTQSHIVINTELNKKYIDVCKELDDLRVSFKQANDEILMWKNKSDIEKCEEDEPTSQIETDIVEEMEGTSDKTLEYLDIEGINYFCKRRSNRQVLESIKRNVTEKDIGSLLLLPNSLSFEQISLLHSSNGGFGKSVTLPNRGCASVPKYMNNLNNSKDYSDYPGVFRLRIGTELSDYSSNEGDDVPNTCTPEEGNGNGICQLEEISNDNENVKVFFRPRGILYDKGKGNPCTSQISVD